MSEEQIKTKEVKETKVQPAIKVYKQDKENKGKIMPETEIALWEKTSAAGKTYLSGKDEAGNFYVGFYKKE